VIVYSDTCRKALSSLTNSPAGASNEPDQCARRKLSETKCRERERERERHDRIMGQMIKLRKAALY